MQHLFRSLRRRLLYYHLGTGICYFLSHETPSMMFAKGSSLLLIAVSFLVGFALADNLTPPAYNEEAAARSSGSIRSVSHRELLLADPPQCPQGFVDCVQGSAGGTTCAEACGGRCCVGDSACDQFTGKVCKDGSCNDFFSCRFANIPFVVNSCKADSACFMATLSSNLVGCCNTAGECRSMKEPFKCTPKLAVVDCHRGYVRGTWTTIANIKQGIPCSTACGGSCCVGNNACEEFTGKVSKDGSCSGTEACLGTEIPLVVNSCKANFACVNARISTTLKNCCNTELMCDSLGKMSYTISRECFASVI